MQENILKEMEDYVFKNIVNTIAHLMLLHYYHFKKDQDSLEQVFNSALEMVVLGEEQKQKLFDEVVMELDNIYFYKIEKDNPLKIKSFI